MLLDMYSSRLEGWNEIIIPLSRYPEKVEWLITYILTINELLHNPTKNLKGNQYPNWGIL